MCTRLVVICQHFGGRAPATGNMAVTVMAKYLQQPPDTKLHVVFKGVPGKVLSVTGEAFVSIEFN